MLAACIILLLLVVNIVYYVATSHPELLAERVKDLVQDKLQVETGFDSYTFSRTSNFPFLSLHLKQLFVNGSHFEKNKTRLLQIEDMSFQFHPWDLLFSRYRVRSLKLSGIELSYFRDADGNSNADFAGDRESNQSTSRLKDYLELDKVMLEDVRLTYLDKLRDKSFAARFGKARLLLLQEDLLTRLTVQGDCFFEGLLFNREQGPFLENKASTVALSFLQREGEHLIELQPSEVILEGEKLHLQGSLATDNSRALSLTLESKGMLIEEAVPLVSPVLGKILAEYEVDQEVAFRLHTAGKIVPGKPLPLRVDFSTEASTLDFRDLHATDVFLSGYYANNCKGDIITESSSCMEIEVHDSKVQGHIGVQAKARINDLRTQEDVILEGQTTLDVKDLQSYTSPAQHLYFEDGTALVNFAFRGPIEYLQDWGKFTSVAKAEAALDNIRIRYGTTKMPVLLSEGKLFLERDHIKVKQINCSLGGIGTKLTGTIEKPSAILNLQAPVAKTTLQLDIPDLNIQKVLNLATGHKSRKPNKLPLGSQVRALIESITSRSTADLRINSNRIYYGKHEVKDASLLMSLKENCSRDSTSAGPACLTVSDLSAQLYDELLIKGDLSITELTDPKVRANVGVKGKAEAFTRLIPRDQFTFSDGQIELDLDAQFNINDLQSREDFLRRFQLDGFARVENVEGLYKANGQHLHKGAGLVRFTNKDIKIEGIEFVAEDTELQVSGEASNYLPLLLGQEAQSVMNLRIHMPYLDLDEIDLEDWRKLMKPREKPLSPYQLIHPLGNSLQQIDGSITFSIAELNILQRIIQDVSFRARLLQDWEENGFRTNCLKIDSLHAQFSEEVAVDANIDLINLDDPIIRTNFAARVDFEKLNDIFPQDLFNFKDGDMLLKASLTGKLYDSWDYQSFLADSEILGNLKVTDGSFDYLYRGFNVRDVQGFAHFDSRDLYIDTLLFNINENHVSSYGHSKGILDFFLLDNQVFHADMHFRTGSFHLDRFKSPAELGQTVDDPASQSANFSPSKIRSLLSKGSVSLGLNMDEVINQNFVAKRVSGDVRVTADSVKLSNCSMSLGGGDFLLRGAIRDLKRNQPRADVQLQFRRCNVKEVFESFNNFGQTDLQSENIEGLASAIIDFKTTLNADYLVQPRSIYGEMFLEIVNGELKNIPAIKNLTGWQFMGRDLRDIAFDTLRNTTHFRGLDMLIEKFYIHSTVLDFGVQGIYSFGDDDNSHLYFELPAENLYITHIDKALLSKIDNRRKGLPIFIQAIERNNKFIWRPSFFSARKRKRMISKALMDRDGYFDR